MRTVLSDRYMVGRVLEAGGDAVMYLGFDQVQKTPITIREFFPNTLCERGDNMEVRIIPGCREHLPGLSCGFPQPCPGFGQNAGSARPGAAL